MILRLMSSLSDMVGFSYQKGRGAFRESFETLVVKSRLFDQNWYLLNNPDVQQSGIDPLRHFCKHGDREGRSPGPGFDSAAYAEAWPDMASSNMGPLEHYLRIGRQAAKALAEQLADGFDAEFYSQCYQDLAALKGADLFAHYTIMGIKEGRFKNFEGFLKDKEARYGPLPDDFNREEYKAINKDISNYFPYDWQFDVHYVELGRREGRRYKNNLKSTPKYNALGQRRCVYAFRGDGIGTRFLTMIYAKILADLIGFELKFIWGEISSPFYGNRLYQQDKITDIFSGGHIFADETGCRGEFTNLCEPSFKILHLEGDDLFYMDREKFQEVAEAYDAVFYDRPFAMLKFMTYEADIAPDVKRIWDSIYWNQQICNFIYSVNSLVNVEESIAIHIRRGDILKMLVEADIEYLSSVGMTLIFQRFVAVKTIIKAINEVRNDENIIICSDDRSSVDVLADIYGAKNVYSSYTSNELTDDQRSAVDIMLLSRAKILISPYVSYFSKCASEVGKCKHIPIQLDLEVAVKELIEIADTIADTRGERVKQLIYLTAGELSTDEETRAHFLERAELLNAAPVFDAAIQPSNLDQ